MHKGEMAKSHYDRMRALVGDIDSPRVIAAIDKALEEVKHEWLDLWDLRKSAERRHGKHEPAPTPPVIGDVSPTLPEAPKPQSAETVSSLINRYISDPRSSYLKTKHSTRSVYEKHLKRIVEDCGQMNLFDLDIEQLRRLYAGWSKDGRQISHGHAVVTMLRSVVHFGAIELADGECVRITVLLRNMRVPVPEPNNREPMTSEQARLIRAKAREKGRPSIALAQAFQFDLPLTQKDVIGEWVPVGEPGMSDVISDNMKWLRGLRWEEIDDDLILRHQAFSRNKRGMELFEFDLKTAPMVMEEFALIDHKKSGPVIVSETSKLPWESSYFRQVWRNIATEAGVPKTVTNRDSKRAGSVEDGHEEDGSKMDRPAAAT